MTDTIHAGATWRRRITISDTNGPVDPTGITALLCPDQPLTVTQAAPGAYDISLTEIETGELFADETRWEFWGRVGGDLLLIASRPVLVVEHCGP